MRKTMYCAKCGKELSETDKFCDACGTPVSVPDTPTAVPESTVKLSAAGAGSVIEVIKRFKWHITAVVCFIISLFPLLYHPVSKAQNFDMNSNIFSLFALIRMISDSDGEILSSDYFGEAFASVAAGLIIISVFAFILLISAIKAIVLLLKKDFARSCKSVMNVLDKFSIIGLIAILTALIFNFLVNAEATSMLDEKFKSRDAKNSYSSMSEYEKEIFDKMKDEAYSTVKKEVEKICYKVSIPAILVLCIGGAASIYMRKKTLPALGINSKAKKYTSKQDWKCEKCGAINLYNSKICSQCGMNAPERREK